MQVEVEQAVSRSSGPAYMPVETWLCSGNSSRTFFCIGLPDYVLELKERNIKFVTILDPCITTGPEPGTYRPLDLGNDMDVWVKRSDGSYALGTVWPEAPTYFGDFSKPEGQVSVSAMPTMMRLKLSKKPRYFSMHKEGKKVWVQFTRI